ncbi:MAG TPA: MFS transporter [Candidatus Binatia bacterium]|jgi:EmrB/QacA subfamily drug resistance transporter
MLSNASPPCDVGVLRGAPDTPGCASYAKRWVLTTTVFGSSIAFLEASVINVSLPAIQQGLGASVGEMQWIASVYTLFLAALTLASGSAGDRYGRRRVFSLGLVILAAASIAAGKATDGRHLIVARAVQGIGSALLVPNSLALLSASFPRRERGGAIGVWSGATALTGSAGPILGGWLVDVLSWRAAFLLMVPLALVTLLVGLVRVPEVRIGSRRPEIDWWGAVLATAGLTLLVFGLIALPHLAAAPAALAAGLAVVLAFAWHERRTAAPMTPPRLFRSPTFLGTNVLTLLLYFALTAVFFVLPFDLVRVHGYSATATGAAYLPFAVPLAVLSRSAGGLADRFGARAPLIAGPLVVGVGFVLLALPGTGGSYWTTFFPAMLVVGLGMAVTVAPLTSTVMGAVDERDVGVASGVNNTAARVATLLAIAIVGIVATGFFARAFAPRIATLDLAPAVRTAIAAQDWGFGSVVVPAGATAGERSAIEQAVNGALVGAFRWVALLSMLFAAAGSVAAALSITDTPVRETDAPDDRETACGHLASVAVVEPRSAGCEECLRLGERWIHLRTCLSCGHVGCCDASRRRHATAHFFQTSHPIVRSMEPGEEWKWCYVDDVPL